MTHLSYLTKLTLSHDSPNSFTKGTKTLKSSGFQFLLLKYVAISIFFSPPWKLRLVEPISPYKVYFIWIFFLTYIKNKNKKENILTFWFREPYQPPLISKKKIPASIIVVVSLIQCHCLSPCHSSNESSDFSRNKIKSVVRVETIFDWWERWWPKKKELSQTLV